MKDPCPCAVVLAAALCLSGCTTSKTTVDDHSYRYFYQHNAGPTRQVEETVSTHSTRTRHYQTPADGVVREGEGLSYSDAEAAQSLRWDSLYVSPQGGR
ncbi:MAG: hypothetical protein ORN83_03265 [Chthoniobacteraceae bacterium]|nr:hypothetical protein [Chthoniobacteraceae bacterium]